MDKGIIMIDKDVTIGPRSCIEEFVILRGRTYIGSDCHIRSHTVIYEKNIIGDYFTTGHGVLFRENNRIGNRVSIGSHSIVEHDVRIGNDCRIHSNVFIPEFCVLEDGCWIGPCVSLTNAKYPYNPTTKQKLQGVMVKKGAKIGAGAIILPGVTIGVQALVGAGAVVTHDVEKGTVVVGNPARVLKHVSDISDYVKIP